VTRHISRDAAAAVGDPATAASDDASESAMEGLAAVAKKYGLGY